MSINRRWVNRGPPNYPFELNRESEQRKGLVAWWPTLGNQGANGIHDYSENGINGQFEGTNVTWIANELGWATDWVDNDDGLTNVNFGNVSLTGDKFTFVAWIRTESDFSLKMIMSKHAGGSNGSFFIDILNSSTAQFVFINDTPSRVTQNRAFNWQANTIYHFCAVYNGAEMIIYINSIAIGAPQAQSGNIRNTSHDLLIGDFDNVAAGFDYSGQIGDTRIYSRALTPIEVRQLYAPQTRWELYQPIHRLQLVRVATIISLNTLTLASSTQALSVTIDEIVALNELALVSSAEVLTVVSAAALVTINTLALASSAPALTVIAVSAQTVLVQTLILASDTPNLIFAALIVIVFDFNITRAVTFDMGVG